MQKLKKGDDVIVTTGKDKGKRGTVLRIVSADLVVVEGANKVKKHQRPNPNKGTPGSEVREVALSAIRPGQTISVPWRGISLPGSDLAPNVAGKIPRWITVPRQSGRRTTGSK